MQNYIEKIIYLNNLACADCANKILTKVQEITYVQNATLNFTLQKLVVKVPKEKENEIFTQVKTIVAQFEPDVVVSLDKEHVHNHENKFDYRLILGIALFALALSDILAPDINIAIYLISYILVGFNVLKTAIANFKGKQIFDENLLMSVATIGAFALGEYAEGVSVMVFYKIGEFFQHQAVNKARKSISDLMDIRPDFATLFIDGKEKTVSPDEVKQGDVIIVKPGEKIPLDGIVINGNSALDTSSLTGEAMPYDVMLDSEVISGCINITGVLLIKVTKEFGQSTVYKILDLVEHSSSQKSSTENFITKFARVYTPFVIFAAVILATVPPIITGDAFILWLNRALVFLVISCPCALVISVPLSFFGGIGSASRQGILVKGSNYLEQLNSIDTVVFDKTGTLTKGFFEVVNIFSTASFTQDEILKYAAYSESFSSHPIALSIVKKYANDIDKMQIKNYQQLPGFGVAVDVFDKKILLGNEKLLQEHNIAMDENINDNFNTTVHIAIDNIYAGYLEMSDQIKSDSTTAIEKLKKLGIKTVMLTGDNKQTGEKIASSLGMDKVYTNLLPHDKVSKIEQLQKEHSLAFVGDGINDAPALARADIGIAMGQIGSDAALNAADIVLMTDQPSKIAIVIGIAKSTRKIVWQNIIFALSIKVIFLILGALGIATMLEAVFGDVGVTLIAVLNSLRALKKPHE